jgi:PAS domain S-box-containing protein
MQSRLPGLPAQATEHEALLELAPDAMLLVDGEDRIRAVNARMEDLFRLPREELVGRLVDGLFSRPWLRLRRPGSSVELPALRGDGSEFPAEISLSAVETADGRMLVAAIRDGSEHALREASLREARERFQRVFEDSPVAMALVGDDFRLTEANGAFCRLTGYGPSELARLTFTDITHPDDIDADLRLARQVFAGELRSYSIDKRYVRKTGEIVWGALTVSVIRDDAGRPLKGLGIVQDISERRAALDLAQAELERLERDHDRILAFAGEGIYHVDERGRITFANPAAGDMLGWSPEELVGKPAHELLHHTRADGSSYPRDRCPIHGPGGSARDTPPSADRFWRRDGTSFAVRLRSDAVPAGPGAGGAVVVFSDESERERMEAALQHAREQAARGRLQAAEAERSRWARELHDETLQGLAGLHMLLASGTRAGMAEGLRDCVRQAQQHIADEMENLRGLISELRPAALDELGLEASLRDLVERIQQVYGLEVEARIELSRSEPRPASEIETAAYRLVQECLSNAARHADATLVVVDVTRRNGSMRIRVSDNGGGFDPARETPGFGLSGMRERVGLLDGELTIASDPGSGTEIVADLPLNGRS